MRAAALAVALILAAGCAGRDDRDPDGEAAIRRLMEVHPVAPPPPRAPCGACPQRPFR